MAIAAGTQVSRRHRRLTWSSVGHGSVPYLLILPVVAVIGAILGYPLFELVRLSFQHYGLFELIKHQGQWVGLDNFRTVLSDNVFWQTLVRTIVFTAVNVGLTMGIGVLLALLLVRLSSWCRLLVTSGLVLVWSMPVVVAVQVWIWMTNFQNGVVNYVFGMEQHDWYATTFSQLSVTTSLIVWGALPFVVISTYAALSQVPHELVEAAEIDGAGSWRVFRDVTFPVLKPVLLILTSLSILWDFGVFTQPYLLIGPSHIHESNYLMSTYLFQVGLFKNDYGIGAAISLLMLLIVAVLSVFYVRKMVRMGDVE